MNIKTKVSIINKLEEEILNELAGDHECECDEPEVYKHIFEGEWDEIHTKCLNCGGFIR